MGKHFERVLVTGGAGFIGSHLVERLIHEGFEVVVIDNLFNSNKDNLAQNFDRKDFHFIEGDILDFELIKEIVKDVDAVFHEAAIVDVPLSIKKPALVNDCNLVGTLNLLNACLNASVERFIYASSCAVYGDQGVLPLDENMMSMPISPYAVTKLAAEKYCSVFYRLYGLETVSLRYFNVYGIRQTYGIYDGVTNTFMKTLLKNKPPVIYGDGKQTRDFVNVEDIIEANILALEKKNAAGKTLNIAYGKAITINELAQILMDILNRNHLRSIHTNPRHGDIRHSCADISLANRILGYSPSMSLKNGLKKLTDEYTRSQ